MPDFRYADPFALEGADSTSLCARSGASTSPSQRAGDQEVVRVAPQALTLLAREAFREINFFYRERHLAQVAAILDDPEASANDRGVAMALLRNAAISAEGKLPMCQDTGTATIVRQEGGTGAGPAGRRRAPRRGASTRRTRRRTSATRRPCPSRCTRRRTRARTSPRRSTSRRWTATATSSSSSPRAAARRTSHSSSRRRRRSSTRRALEKFMAEKMRALGTAACPPYHLVFVIGGTSAEATMKTVKLASAGYLDRLPTTGSDTGRAFRDPALEAKALELARQTGIGAQFGGKYFALDVRVIRLPRHGASCPVGVGVSCSADRNVQGRIDRDGIWLEELCHDPVRFIPEKFRAGSHRHGVPVDLNRPMAEIAAELVEAPRLDAPPPHRADRRRPRHRPREAQGAPRQGRGAAAVLQGPPRLLRRAGQDAGGDALGLLRADDGRAHGLVRGPLPVAAAARG